LTSSTAFVRFFPASPATLPPQLKVQPLADQSIFVRSAVSGVIREAVIAACLTGLMILIFLASWRSTLIIAVSIPLSILTSIIVLSFLGETINIMTLGGLALAVGMLVDDATVENREHQSESGSGQGDQAGDPRRRVANRRSCPGIHAQHLHRVPANVFFWAASRVTSSCR
jgi:multidrug efflux pump subunit AcrB